MKRRYQVLIYTQYSNGALRPKPIKRSYERLPKVYSVPVYLKIVSVSVFDKVKFEWEWSEQK